MFEIIADIIYNSVLMKDLKKKKLVICDEICSSDTLKIWHDDGTKHLNGNDLPNLGNTASVKRVTVSDLKNIYKLVCNDFHVSIIQTQ